MLDLGIGQSKDKQKQRKEGRKVKMPTATVTLPIIDLSSPDRSSTAKLIRQACKEHGFFYIVNHGLDKELLQRVFEESNNFFSLPMEEKIKYPRKEHRGYNPLFAEKLNPTFAYKGDSKESFYIGPLGDPTTQNLNQWPEHDQLTKWRPTMESLYWKVFTAAKETLSLLAMSLNLEHDFFEKIGALSSNNPEGFVRLLRYPGEVVGDEETYGAYAHSDYGMIALLMTDGTPGLQICKERSQQPQVWEDVPHTEGAIIVNIGDMTERWTNCLYRSTLHRVTPTGKERYSVVFFLDPNPDTVVECLPSCCSESCPPRYPPIRSADYFKERFKLTYGSS